MDDFSEYSKLVEAALFMSPRALSLSEIASIVGMASLGPLQEILNKLVEKYRSGDTALEILRISDKYMFSLKEPYASKVGRLANAPDLSRGSLRILAYINKNNGILQSRIVKLFGASTYDYMKELEEKDFVKTVKQGRSKKVETTLKFKEYFNV